MDWVLLTRLDILIGDGCATPAISGQLLERGRLLPLSFSPSWPLPRLAAPALRSSITPESKSPLPFV
jgi:hypothetical protein